MTTYTPITEAETDPDAPATSSLFKRWWKNPLAMFEGSAGAPKLQLAAVDTWLTTVGGVGTYCFAKATVDKAFGGTVAGSTLTPTSALCGVIGSGGAANGNFDAGAVLSGTWQAMGTFDLSAAISSTFGAASGATLWQRIA